MSGLLGASDVASLLGVSRSAVSNYRKRGKLTPAEIIGGRPAYRREDVETLRERKRGGRRPMIRTDDGRRKPRRIKPSSPTEAGSWMPQAQARPWRPLPTLDEIERGMR